jgi:hypothetical protein
MTLDIPENQTIDQGVYPAILTSIGTKVIEKGAYAGETIRIWKFQVEVDGKSESIEASSSLAFGPKSKAYQWFTALMGRNPVFGEKNVQLAGRPCRLHLIVDEESGYNRVAAVLPAEKGQRVAAAVPLAPTAINDGLPEMPATFQDGTPIEDPPVEPEDILA